jgi:hypothetical protein
VPRRAQEQNRTIYQESTVGKRLAKVHKPGTMYVIFQGGKIPIVSRIYVGRDSNNAIVLEDVLVSRRHAVIQKVKHQRHFPQRGTGPFREIHASEAEGHPADRTDGAFTVQPAVSSLYLPTVGMVPSAL